MHIRLFIPGIPKGQPRGRAVATPNGKVRVYNPTTAEGWKSRIADELKPYLPATPLAGAIKLSMEFWMPRPKRLMRRKDPPGKIPHLSTPDYDNLAKAATDILKEIGVIRDDKQVYWGLNQKYYAPKDARPGMRFELIAEDEHGQG